MDYLPRGLSANVRRNHAISLLLFCNNDHNDNHNDNYHDDNYDNNDHDHDYDHDYDYSGSRWCLL